MASSARIEELEKKFNENPRRYFAPLANEYRKAGDLTQAISICRTYVPQQPGHMSGHIVFGQALFESGELDESRAVFESALLLDPENLIALRHLGDIARSRGEISAARGWYRRVLDADPRNEEMAAELSGLDGVADASAPASVNGVDGAAPDGLGGWHEINPERTLELPGSLAEAAQRISENTASWLETESDVPAPPATVASAPPAPLPPTPAPDLASDIEAEERGESSVDGFYGDAYTASMGEASVGDDPADVSSDHGLGLEVMEFVPPTRRSAELAAPVPGESGDTPAAFVTETMAELYLQQGFRDEALEVYRQLLAQSPDDDTLRERVAQLEAGSRSSFSSAAGVSDSVIEAATQRRNAPTVRSIRAFFGDLASRRVVTRRADRMVPPQEAGPVAAEAPAAEIAVEESMTMERAVETTSVDTASVETTAVLETPVFEAAPPAPVAEAMSAEEPPAPVQAEKVAEPVATPPAAPQAPRAPEPPTSGFGIRPGMYDHAAFAEDPFGSPDLGGGSFGDSALAEPDFGGETLISRRRDEVDEFGLPTSGDAESFAFDQTESAALAPAAPQVPPAASGSVNGLFPDARVAPGDEAAAETLSTAFGGSPVGLPSEPQGPGVRRASTELSLDSVFRETPPPQSPSAGPARRDQSAFSFDQFFGYDPFANGDQGAAQDAATEASGEHPGPATGGSTEPAAETEQFSSWLSGLKKK
jgi:tetratricopeptide (TPR) repeat protein